LGKRPAREGTDNPGEQPALLDYPIVGAGTGEEEIRRRCSEYKLAGDIDPRHAGTITLRGR